MLTHKGDSCRRVACGQVHHLRMLAGAAVKICIVSDSHDRADPLERAAQAALAAGARVVLHCGDVIGVHTLRPLLDLGLAVHVVHGNNLGDLQGMNRLAEGSGGALTYHGSDADIVLGARRIFITHYPHLARGMACTGDFDLVCCGHTHEAALARQVNIRGGQTWWVNPGTVAGIGAPATWVLGDLDTLSFEVRSLPAG